MLTLNLSKTRLRKLLKFSQSKFLFMIFVKTENETHKNELHFLIGVAMGL